MRTVGIARLKAALSAYLSRVKAGEEIVITERGQPVARLTPVRPGLAGRERLTVLEREGAIRRGPGKIPESFWTLPRPPDAESLLRAALDEERSQGR